MPDLNFTLKKTFKDKYSVRFKVENILDNTYREQMTLGGQDYYTTSYQLGRTYSLSFGYTLK